MTRAPIAFVLFATWLAAPAAAQTVAPSGLSSIDEVRARAREDTYETARGYGMGTGGRANARGTSALIYNTANLPLSQVYHIESAFAYVAGQNAYSIGSAVVDSTTNALAVGFSFRGVHGGGNRDYGGWDGRLAAGYSLSQRIALGVGLRFLNLGAHAKTASGQAIGPHAKGFTMDAALRFTPHEKVQIAALAYNLVNRHSALTPVMVGGGISVTPTEGLDIAADCLVDLSTFRSAEVIVGGGFEYLAADHGVLRLGYRRDQGRDLHSITSSIGYVAPQYGIEAALRQDLGAQHVTQLLLVLRYQMQ